MICIARPYYIGLSNGSRDRATSTSYDQNFNLKVNRGNSSYLPQKGWIEAIRN